MASSRPLIMLDDPDIDAFFQRVYAQLREERPIRELFAELIAARSRVRHTTSVLPATGV